MLLQNQILVDRYQLLDRFSDKTGRQTWKALDRQTRQFVVLKVLLFGTGIQWQDIKLFEREAQLLRSLDLPQIPRYLDDFELDFQDVRGFVLVQSYLEARSLESYLEAGHTFTQAEVKSIAEQLLLLLGKLHDRTVPIIHRDIKPSNILLSNRSAHSIGQIYLVDFGAAQTSEFSGKGTVTIVGTFGYIPPEQFAGQTVPASDLYSLGITLIALLTGISADALSHSPGRMDLESLTNVDLAFIRWLRKMTEPTLERRFKSTRQALDALKQLSESSDDELSRRKPAHTQIVLQKSIDQFSLKFPSKGFKLFDFCSCVFTTIFSMPFLALGLIPILGWLIMIFLIYLIGRSWLNLIYSLFGHCRLKITLTQIQLTHYVFGVCFHSRSSPREEVIKLERVNPYIKVVESAEGDGRTRVEAEILIWAGTQVYHLSNMTMPELDWLSQELSDWLELPIEQRALPTVKA
jgi:serine/threonine protein kinase